MNRHLFDTISDLAHSDSVGDVVEVKPINDEGYRPGNIERPNNDRPDNGHRLESPNSGCVHKIYWGIGNGRNINNKKITEISFSEDYEGCLYTVDSVLLNNGKLRYLLNKLGERMSYIRLFQLPHHGSYGNFSLDVFNILRDNGLELWLFFASYGSNNRYHHPSKKLIKSIYGERKFHAAGTASEPQIIGIDENPKYYFCEAVAFPI